LESAVDELRNQGVSVEEIRIDEISGKKFCFFYDPNDQPLELYEE
jgi:glyoxylase I family protein